MAGSYTYPRPEDPHITAARNRVSQLQSKEEAMAYIQKLQRQVEALNYFKELTRKEVYGEMLQTGKVWQGLPADIGQLSRQNLNKLHILFSKISKQLPQGWENLYTIIKQLPYTLKHNTKAEYEGLILKTHSILSKTEIGRQNKGFKGGTQEGVSQDQVYIHNEDFVFFRLSVGDEPAHSRFGSTCFVFKPQKLFDIGWISLHDMLSPGASNSMVCFPAPMKGTELGMHLISPIGDKKNPFAKPLRIMTSSAKEGPDRMSFTYQGGRRDFKRSDEVFFGPDIRDGIACSVVIELFLMGNGCLEAAIKLVNRNSKDLTKRLAVLVFNLFRPEVKIPRRFLFQDSDVIRIYRDLPDPRKKVGGID